MKYLTTRWILPWFIPIPVPVFTKKFSNPALHGICFWFFIIISESLQEKEGCIQHELTHCKQYWRFVGFHYLFYKLFKRWRFLSEVSAFRNQLKHEYNYYLEIFVNAIYTNYNCGVSKDNIRIWLTSKEFKHIIKLVWFL